MQVQKVSNLTFELDSHGQTGISKLQNCKERQFQVSILPITSPLENCFKNSHPAPRHQSSTDETLIVIWWESLPLKFCVISKSVCDLIGAIKQNDDWDPTELFEKKHLVPPPIFVDDSIPFADGVKLIVDTPINPQGTTKVYIDNIISLMVEIEGTEIWSDVTVPHSWLSITVHAHCITTNQSLTKPWKQ
jgi:hypothetical protein